MCTLENMFTTNYINNSMCAQLKVGLFCVSGPLTGEPSLPGNPGAPVFP